MHMHYFVLVLSLAAPVLCRQQRQQQQQEHPALAGVAPTAWQAGVLCSTPKNSTYKGTMNEDQTCRRQNAALLAQWRYLLKDSTAWPSVKKTSGSATFQVLARYLKPLESNVRFAQAYCLSLGGQLAYWDSPKQYSDLAQLALSLAKDTKQVWHVYVGAVQLAGSKEPDQGWLWVHNNSRVSAAFPWAKGEPNQHNGDKAGHVEDCAAVATYHGQTATLLVDDFPCNYADSNGKYQNKGWNPQLSVACRIPAA